MTRNFVVNPPPPRPGDDGDPYGGQQDDVIVDAAGVSNIASPGRFSFKDSLLNTHNGGVDCDLDVDFCLTDGDVCVDKSAKIASISFSDRVHNLMADNMKQTVFVHLMGLSIGFRTLNAQLLRLWKLSGVFSMVDVGSGFMIRFGVVPIITV